jgi:hypothetical protein
MNGKIMERPLNLDRVSKAIQQELRTNKKSRVEVKKRPAPTSRLRTRVGRAA